MRSLLTIGFTASTVLIASCLVTAAPASATRTVLCQANQSICPAEEIYTGSITFLAVEPVFLTSVGNVECEHSMISATALGAASPQLNHITLIHFTGNCRRGIVSCTVSTKNVGTVLLLKVGANVGEAQSHENRVLINCSGIIHCVVGGLFSMTVLGADSTDPARVLLYAPELEAIEGLLCPDVTELDAGYAFTQPQQKLYVSQGP